LSIEPLRLGTAFEHHDDVLAPNPLNYSIDPLNQNLSRKKKVPSDHSKIILALGFLLIITPWVHHSSFQWRLSSLGSEVTDMQMKRKKVISNLKRATESLRKTKDEIRKMETDKATSIPNRKNSKKNSSSVLTN
jgi:hypothetical protein